MRNDIPAFPVPDNVAWDKSRDTAVSGMTLRDYFAAAALQGMRVSDYQKFEHMAKDAYDVADAVMKAREQ